MKINVQNLVCFGDVGIYPHEKTKKTKILVSLQVFLREISPIVDYDEIIAITNSTVAKKHYDYIEELAMAIRNNVEGISDNIKSVLVKVQKCILGNIVEELSVEV